MQTHPIAEKKRVHFDLPTRGDVASNSPVSDSLAEQRTDSSRFQDRAEGAFGRLRHGVADRRARGDLAAPVRTRIRSSTALVKGLDTVPHRLSLQTPVDRSAFSSLDSKRGGWCVSALGQYGPPLLGELGVPLPDLERLLLASSAHEMLSLMQGCAEISRISHKPITRQNRRDFHNQRHQEYLQGSVVREIPIEGIPSYFVDMTGRLLELGVQHETLNSLNKLQGAEMVMFALEAFVPALVLEYRFHADDLVRAAMTNYPFDVLYALENGLQRLRAEQN